METLAKNASYENQLNEWIHDEKAAIDLILNFWRNLFHQELHTIITKTNTKDTNSIQIYLKRVTLIHRSLTFKIKINIKLRTN